MFFRLILIESGGFTAQHRFRYFSTHVGGPHIRVFLGPHGGCSWLCVWASYRSVQQTKFIFELSCWSLSCRANKTVVLCLSLTSTKIVWHWKVHIFIYREKREQNMKHSQPERLAGRPETDKEQSSHKSQSFPSVLQMWVTDFFFFLVGHNSLLASYFPNEFYLYLNNKLICFRLPWNYPVMDWAMQSNCCHL